MKRTIYRRIRTLFFLTMAFTLASVSLAHAHGVPQARYWPACPAGAANIINPVGIDSQTFIATANQVVAVDACLQDLTPNPNPGMDQLTFQLRQGGAFGPVIAAQAVVLPRGMAAGRVHVHFAAPVPTVAGNVYALEVVPTAVVDNWGWFNTPGAYPGGNAWLNGVNFGGLDYIFATLS